MEINLSTRFLKKPCRDAFSKINIIDTFKIILGVPFTFVEIFFFFLVICVHLFQHQFFLIKMPKKKRGFLLK